MKYALIDGYGLIFRAFHALPADLATSKGEPTNAVLGFCQMLLHTMERERPDGVAIAFDVGKAFRHSESADYKAHRPPMPEELRGQVGRVREVVEAFGFPIYEMRGFEADDVIGSLTARLESEGHAAAVVTGDTDLLQLVTENVEVVTPAGGRFSDVTIYTPEAVLERYGFEPRYIPDYKALVGDSSDNIRGVPGVGDKTARTLIQTYGSTEDILARVDEVKPDRIRRALQENAEQLIQSKRLTTIVKDVEVDTTRLHVQSGGYDRDAVWQLFRELEFRSLMNRLPAVEPAGSEANAQESVPAPDVEIRYYTLDTPAKVAQVAAQLMTADRVAFDTETTGKAAVGSDLVGVSFSAEEGVAYYVPIGHEAAGGSGPAANPQALLDELRPLLEGDGPGKVAHNAKFDLMVLRQSGIEAGPLVFDTSLAAYLLTETSVGLKELAATRLGVQMTPIESLLGRGASKRTMAQVPVDECATYAAADADMTLRLYGRFLPELAHRNQLHLLNRLEMPLVPVLADMELAGIPVDTEALKGLSRQMYEELQRREAAIKEMAGHDLNLKSPQQMSKLLYTELGLKGTRKTASGGYSTDVHALEALAGEHPIIDEILVYRQLSKLKDTYVDALPLLVNPRTRRVHTSFNQTVASTGRLSSSDPNLQNIPVRTELGREVRKAFIASNSPTNAIMPGPTVLLSADYSQIELRVLAHLTGEPRLVEAFALEEDIHALTASQLYEVPLSEVTPDMRRTGKTINFGIIYGMTGFRLARDTGLGQKKAADFVRRYMEQFPKIKALFESTVSDAETHGYVQTPLGRRRYLPDLRSSNPQRRDAARRAAINMPIQGMAADIIKFAMINIHSRLRERQFHARMLLQVHDELVFEVPEAELQEVTDLVMREMSTAMELSVPVRVEAKYGSNWGEMVPLAASATIDPYQAPLL